MISYVFFESFPQSVNRRYQSETNLDESEKRRLKLNPTGEAARQLLNTQILEFDSQ